MTRKDILMKLIKKYATSYYSGQSEVSDEYFDSLVEELREIDPNNEMLKTGWGYDPQEKVDHWWNLHIGSLGKVKEGQSIPTGYQRLSAKLDGLSVVSYYVDGKRVQAITRGNGNEGKDVTETMKLVSPETEYFENGQEKPFTGAIRGEVVMPQSVWKEKYEPIKIKEDNPSLNSRNIASGLMNRTRQKITQDEAKDLDYVVYKILYDDDRVYHDIFEMHWAITINNPEIHHVDALRVTSPITESELREIYDGFLEKYPCDGIVFSNYDEQDGFDEVAYKFTSESAEVAVEKVTFNVTRTGRMAPIIWYSPVELSGASCRKCTGFNAAFIRDNKIGPGAVIEVCRSGEVIPYIKRVVTPSEEVYIPEICPCCGTDLIWEGDDLICESENESQLAYHFLTTCAPVDKAGWSLYTKIVDNCDLHTERDLIDFLHELSHYGVGSVLHKMKNCPDNEISGNVTWSKVEKILQMLVEEIDPVRFLCACSIKGVSWSTAESLLMGYPEIIKDSRTGFNQDKLYKVEGVGYKTVQVLSKFRDRISSLSSCVTIKDYVVPETRATLFKVAITGALSMKRADFDAKLQEHGIQQSGNFKEIKYLITNNPDSTSSKMKRAQDNGVEIISEEEFVSKYFI